MKQNPQPQARDRRRNYLERMKHAIRMAHDPMFVDRAENLDDLVSSAEEEQRQQRRDRGH